MAESASDTALLERQVDEATHTLRATVTDASIPMAERMALALEESAKINVIVARWLRAAR